MRYRVVQSLKEPQAAAPTVPAANGKDAQPKVQQQQQQPKTVEQPAQQASQQTSQQGQQQPRARSRSRNKRDDSNGRRQAGNANAPTQPTTILQRSPKNSNKAGLPPTGAAPAQQQQVVKQQEQVAAAGSGMLPISREDGIAAGVAILGMISQNSSSTQQQQQQASPSPRAGRGRNQRKKQQQQQQNEPALLLPTMVSPSSSSGSPTNAAATPVNKEQLKQALISLLDDSQFFDQIYHAYVDRVHLRS